MAALVKKDNQKQKQNKKMNRKRQEGWMETSRS